jgi:hypothetical protein
LPQITPISELQRRFEHWLFDLPAEVGGKTLHYLAGPLRYVYALLRDIVRGTRLARDEPRVFMLLHCAGSGRGVFG